MVTYFNTSKSPKLLADLSQVGCQNLLSTGLLQVVSTGCNKYANDKLQQALKLKSILQLVDELQQAGKIDLQLATLRDI